MDDWRTQAAPDHGKGGAYRKGAKPRAQRAFAEDCDDGDTVVWPGGPPAVRGIAGWALAPSDRGKVTMYLNGAAFVRFEVGGELVGEPREVAPGQAIRVVHSYRG